MSIGALMRFTMKAQFAHDADNSYTETITKQLQNTNVSRFAAVQDQGQVLEYKRGFSNSRTSLDSGCRRKRG